jgi:hypothetical protein
MAKVKSQKARAGRQRSAAVRGQRAAEAAEKDKSGVKSQEARMRS